MKHHKLTKGSDSDPISLYKWRLDSIDDFQKHFESIVLKAAREVVEILFEDEDNIDVTFPFTSALKKRVSPLTISVNFITDERKKDYSKYLDLDEALRLEVDTFGGDEATDARLLKIAAALHNLANYVEQKCRHANPPK